MIDALLLFPGASGVPERWLRLAGGAVVDRGEGMEAARRGEALVAVVPAEEVMLRWIDLPDGLTGAQAAAAARLALADASAQPIGDMHVAVGGGEEGLRCAALVPQARMAQWLAQVDADAIVPDVLLLEPPADGFALMRRGTIGLYRARDEAFALEPELAALIVGGRPVTEVDEERFDSALAVTLAPPLLDLRQGAFARRRQMKLGRARVRRLALIAAAILLVTLAMQIAAVLRYTFAADAAEAETRKVAARALPRAAGLSDPAEDLERRLAELRGGGAGFSATAGAALAALRATPNVELTALSFGEDGTMRLALRADGVPAVEAVVRRIEGAGFAVASGTPRRQGEHQLSDLTVRPR